MSPATATASFTTASDLDTFFPAITYNFLDSLTSGLLYIAKNATNNIQIGPLTTTSVHCGGIDCQGSTINNGGARLTGAVSIGNAQTNGVLNIGTGASRTATGIINIGNGAGTAIIPINIGGSGSTTTIGGKLLSSNYYFLIKSSYFSYYIFCLKVSFINKQLIKQSI